MTPRDTHSMYQPLIDTLKKGSEREVSDGNGVSHLF